MVTYAVDWKSEEHLFYSWHGKGYLLF